MVKKKSKKEISWMFFSFFILMLVVSFAAGYYEAKDIYRRADIWDMNYCLDACGILRNSKVFYHSYTKALNQRQDYYIECAGHNLINITPLGSPIFLDNFTGGLCL